METDLPFWSCIYLGEPEVRLRPEFKSWKKGIRFEWYIWIIATLLNQSSSYSSWSCKFQQRFFHQHIQDQCHMRGPIFYLPGELLCRHSRKLHILGGILLLQADWRPNLYRSPTYLSYRGELLWPIFFQLSWATECGP